MPAITGAIALGMSAVARRRSTAQTGHPPSFHERAVDHRAPQPTVASAACTTMVGCSESSAAAASTPSSDPTRAASTSTLRTGSPAPRSRSAPSAGTRWRSCPGTAPSTSSPAHKVPYRANMWALRALGVRQVLAPCAVGSLSPNSARATVVVPDQLVDRTRGRADTYFDSGAVHVDFADPYCPTLRAAVTGLPGVVDGGTMVVIEGPRFSTRAESQWFAAQGFSLVNMTGYPEAVLARELEICYAAIALVTDLDAGVGAGAGVKAVDVFAEFAKNIEPFKKLVREAIGRVDRPSAPARIACRTTGVDPAASSCREGAADRGGRFHRFARSAPRCGPRGTRWSPSTRCCPPRTGQRRLPTGCIGSTSATPTRWPRCWPAWTWCAIRRRWSGAGVDAADAPAYGGHNDLGHRRPAGADVRRRGAAPGAGLVDGGVRAGTLHCDEHGPWTRCRGAGRTSTPGSSSTAARRAARNCTGASSTRTRLRPRSLYAASKTAQEHYALAWSEATRWLGGGAALPQCLRPRHAARHPLLRGGRDLPVVAGKGRIAKGFRGRRADARLRPRRRRGRGQRRGDRSEREGFTRGQCLLGTAHFDPGGGRARCADARGGTLSPVVTGQYRSGDVRHIVADPSRAAEVLGFRAAVTPGDGLREFAFAPLR